MRVVNKNKRNEIFLLGLVVFVMAVFLYRDFIFGGRLYVYLGDLNDDTFQSYLPSYQLIVNMLRNGNFSLYSTALGLGNNILVMQMLVFDPFALPLYFAGIMWGVAAVAPALVFAQVLRILCAAMACRFFLGSFSLSPVSRCLAAVTYAFSAYMVGVIGQHYVFATAPVFMALLLGCIERSRYNRKYVIPLAVCVMIMGFWSVYFSYAILLTGAGYAVVRFLQRRQRLTLRAALEWFGPLLAGVSCGLALSALIFVPAVFSLLGTTDRVGGDGFAEVLNSFKPVSFETAKSVFLRIFSEQLQGTANQWQGWGNAFYIAHISCSVLLPIAVVQYIADLFKRPRPYTRPVTVSLIFSVLVAGSFFVSFTGMLYNLFVGHMWRYTYVFLPLFAFLIAWVTHRAVVFRCFYVLPGYLCALVCVVLICFGCEWGQPGAAFSGAAAAAGICGATFLLHMLSLDSAGKFTGFSAAVLTVVVGGVLLADGNIGLVSNRNTQLKDSYADVGFQDTQVEEILRDNDLRGDVFRRFERNESAVPQPQFTYSNVAYYRGTSFYLSVINKYLQLFRRDFCGMPDYYLSSAYARNGMGPSMDGTIADVLGLSFVASGYPTRDPAWELVLETAEKAVYRNAGADTVGLFYSDWCSLSDYAEMDTAHRQAMLAHTVLINDGVPQSVRKAEGIPLTEVEDAVLWDSLNALTGNADRNGGGGIRLEGNEEGICLAEVSLDTDLFLQPDVQVFLRIEENVLYSSNLGIRFNTGYTRLPAGMDGRIGERSSEYVPFSFAEQDAIIKEGSGHVLKMPADTISVEFSLSGAKTALDIEGLSVWISRGKGYTSDGVHLENPGMAGAVAGTVDAPEPGILMVPVSYEDGWSVRVDGQTVPLLRADHAFLAVEIPEGRHNVLLQYRTPGLQAGALISAAGLAGFAGLFFLTKKNGGIKSGRCL